MRGIGEVVNGDHLDVGLALVGGAQEAAAGPAQPVDGDTYGHENLVSWWGSPSERRLVATLRPALIRAIGGHY